MTVQEMREWKKAMGLSNKQVAARSGVSLGTVQKVFSGETEVPRYKTLIKLEKAFLPEVKYTEHKGPYLDMVAEPAPAYNAKKTNVTIHTTPQKGIGPYGLKDYLELPEDVRAELIDGHFYDMSSPSMVHQQIALEVAARMREHIRRNKGKCKTFIAPADVQLDRDEKTILQPDVFVVCKRDQITKSRIVGAPDMVVEVLSPGSWSRDMIMKLQKYREAGVREYWVILPDQKVIYVYLFEKAVDPEFYTFEDRVPVGIWDGKCEIDFCEIFDEINFMYDG